MTKFPFLAVALFAATLAIPARAQDAMKKDAAPKPADSPSKVVIDSWNDIGRKLTAMAEDFPEDKYDFKPTPAQRSFAEQLLHAAGSNYYFINPLTGKKPPAEEDLKRDKYKTKADVVAMVKKAFADGAAALQAKGDKGMPIWWSSRSAISRSAVRPISPTASSSTAVNTMASWWFTTGSQAWYHRNPVQRNK